MALMIFVPWGYFVQFRIPCPPLQWSHQSELIAENYTGPIPLYNFRGQFNSKCQV